MQNAYRRLGSKSIYLSPLLTDDDSLNSYAKWFNDNNVNLGLNLHDKLVDLDYVKNTLVNSAPNKLNFSIITNSDESLIGLCSITILNNISCELSILIGESSYRGCRIGREVLLTLCKFCFEELRMHRVRTEFNENNRAATGCVSACGFDTAGTLRDTVFHEGKFINTTIYELLERNWWSDISISKYRTIMCPN